MALRSLLCCLGGYGISLGQDILSEALGQQQGVGLGQLSTGDPHNVARPRSRGHGLT